MSSKSEFPKLPQRSNRDDLQRDEQLSRCPAPTQSSLPADDKSLAREQLRDEVDGEIDFDPLPPGSLHA